MDSAGKVAIVTGAASGIGRALAQRLASQGWRIACCDIQEEKGVAVAAEIGHGDPDRVAFFKCDVSDYDAQAKVFQQVWDKWGRLDALLANAGFSDRGSIYIFNHRGKIELPPKPNLLSIDNCYKSFLYGVQLAIHFMRQNRVPGGSIVTTSSIASVHPHQTFPEYTGAKAAVNQFVRTVAPILLAKEKISINAILPGIVPTGAVPQASINVTRPEHITPIETVVGAYEICLQDPSISGQLIECSADKQLFLPPPSFANGEVTKRACTVWEPLFKLKHHEASGLPDAIQ